MQGLQQCNWVLTALRQKGFILLEMHFQDTFKFAFSEKYNSSKS